MDYYPEIPGEDTCIPIHTSKISILVLYIYFIVLFKRGLIKGT